MPITITFFTGKMNLFDLWICVFTFFINCIPLLQKNGQDRGARYYTMREALAQDPYSYKTRSRERGQVLQSMY